MTEQIHLYSVDTGYFYTEVEDCVAKNLNVRYFYISKLKNREKKIIRRRKQLRRLLKSDEVEDKIKSHQYSSDYSMGEQLKLIKRRLSIVENEVREMKKLLRQLQDENTEQREIKLSKLKSRDIVSLFSSSLTRAMKIETGELTKDIIIVKTFYFKVLEDIIKNGFTMGGDEYVPFTASAGQIRTKKTVFIKEEVYKKIRPHLMCGLSPEIINDKGGINVNKFLAYLALSNSATEIWENFDITKSIVVEDMETMVSGTVDYIDYNDYSIERKEMEVPIPHTDGCGMMLPKMGEDKEKTKAMMIRMPWMKGLMVPFGFDKFIRENNRDKNNTPIGKIKDIYGKEYDILEDGIEVIFTKSQFKMWKYYDSWQEYIDFFHEYDCEAGYANKEPDVFGNAKLNYQMLQTLTDITDEELERLSSRTSFNIQQMGRDREVMLGALGVVPHNQNKNTYQRALELYPEMLKDTYGRQTIKSTKKGMVKKARAARLDTEAMYTFLVPDLYAVCEYIFKGIEKPKGLLADGEVSCKLYEDGKKLDCLRSPHLYREHAVRKNKVNRDTSRWFVSNGIYTSSNDLISKMLQFDNDGDTSLVVGDELFVEIAERNMEGIVPLYYEMKGADPESISRHSIYTSMTNAYSGGNIGAISNNITKIWNHKEPDLDMVKLLCLENNFTIDYAKTLFKPQRPKHVEQPLVNFTRNKVPYFFMYAKDKSRIQVEAKNNSVVNRLKNIIADDDIVFEYTNVGHFDYTMLMNSRGLRISDESYEMVDEIIDTYEDLDLHKYFFIKYENENDNNIAFLYQDIREQLLDIGAPVEDVVDILVDYLYRNKESSYKTTLWESFGEELIANLKKNIIMPLDAGWVMCDSCGTRVRDRNSKSRYCTPCGRERDRKLAKERMRIQRKKKREEG